MTRILIVNSHRAVWSSISAYISAISRHADRNTPGHGSAWAMTWAMHPAMHHAPRRRPMRRPLFWRSSHGSSLTRKSARMSARSHDARSGDGLWVTWVRRMGDTLGDSAQYWRASEAMTGERDRTLSAAASGRCDCTPSKQSERFRSVTHNFRILAQLAHAFWLRVGSRGLLPLRSRCCCGRCCCCCCYPLARRRLTG